MLRKKNMNEKCIDTDKSPPYGIVMWILFVLFFVSLMVIFVDGIHYFYNDFKNSNTTKMEIKVD